MSQTELAAKLGVSYPRINELIHGKRGITPDTALRLERLFGMEAPILAQPAKHLRTPNCRKEGGEINKSPS
jgi:transcriptional regulator with XRE-family HTH domain